MSQILDKITGSLPAEVFLQAVNFSSDNLLIKGTSLSEIGIAGFIKNLENEGFDQVQLTSISFAGIQTGETGIKFALSAKLAK